MKENVRRKAEEFNKYYDEVMSKDNTEEFLEKTLEVMARVSWAMEEKKIDFGLRVIFIDGDTGDVEEKFNKKVLEFIGDTKDVEQFVIDYKLSAIAVVSMLDIDIKHYPEYICKTGMTMDGELELEIIYLHNLDADYLKEILNNNAKTI